MGFRNVTRNEGRRLGRQEIFRHRRHSRARQHLSDDGRGRAARGSGRRETVPHRRRPPPSGGDRQGHAPVGLYDRAGPGRRFRLSGHGRAHLRPGADAGGGHADALDARRPGRDDLGLSQRLRRQRDQALRAGRLQAVRRDRAEDRGPDGRRPGPGAGAVEQAGSGQADRRRPGPLHRDRQTGLPETAVATGPAHRGRLRQRRRLQGRPDHPVRTGGRGLPGRRRPERDQYQCRMRLHPSANPGRGGQALPG